MNYIIQLAWALFTFIARLMVKQDILDYHWIGGVTEQQAIIKVVALPQYREKQMSLDFTLYQGGAQVMRKVFIKEVNQSAFEIVVGEDLATEGTQYSFKYQAQIVGSERKSKLREGQFKTFRKKQDKLSFIASSCTTLMSEANSFDEMSALRPDFFINLGDIHYSAFSKAQPEDFVFAYHELFKSKKQRDFYQKYPLVYTLDDHDVGNNNANYYSPSVPHVNQAYKELVPHFPLSSTNPERGIQHKFTAGSTLFMILDMRSFKFYRNETYNKTTNLGEDQLQWLLQSLNEAAESDGIEGVVVVMSVPWYSPREWNETTTLHEKVAIAERISALEFNMHRRKDGKNKFLVAVSGDTHMLAFDTGYHNDEYGGFPIFQCSSLDSTPSCKQGGYTGDIYENRGQFCHFEISKHKKDSARSCLKFQGFSRGDSVLDYDSCDLSKYEKQTSLKIYLLDQLASINQTNPEEMTEEDQIRRNQLQIAIEVQKLGTICPISPKIKIKGTLSIFGLIYFVFVTYTLLRNIFSNRIE